MNVFAFSSYLDIFNLFENVLQVCRYGCAMIPVLDQRDTYKYSLEVQEGQ